MKEITVQHKQDFDLEDFVKRTALDSDYSTLIRDDCIIRDETGKLQIVYFKLPKIPHSLIEAVKKIRYISDVRTEGLKTNSRIFAYRPRETIRKDFCSSTSLSQESPVEHSIICDFGVELARYYEQYCPDVYNAHLALSDDKIRNEWKIKGTPFTSGIVNKNNPLKYHFDSGNFDNVYSNMVAFKNRVAGGHLSIPEFDIGLEIADNSVVLFDGQKILHGVTPIKYENENSYRFTIVYYTLKKMWNCEPLTVEIARIKKIKTQREFKRYDRLIGNLPSDKL